MVYAEPDGREITLAVRGPGDVIGEFSSRDGLPRSATVQAIEPGITSKLSDARFIELVEGLGLKDQLDGYIMGKVRATASHAWQLAHHTTTTRLADLLTTLIEAAGPDHPAPTTIAMPQEELAATLGLARSAITPVLAKWKSSGLIRISRGMLHVADPRSLLTFRSAAVSTSGQNSAR